MRRALARARRHALGWYCRVPETWLAGGIDAAGLDVLRERVSWFAGLPSADEPRRSELALALGAPILPDGTALATVLEGQRLREPLHAGGGVREVEVLLGGRPVRFRYPHAPGMANQLLDVLNGTDYPRFTPAGWDPTLICDIGAHVGCAALYFATAYPRARVVCWEPSSESFAHLVANAAPFPNIEVRNVGLSDREERCDLFPGASSSMQASVVAGAPSGDPAESVELRRASLELDGLGEERISVLKIDTEGYEVPILSDLSARIPRIDFLHLEYHSERDRRALDALVADQLVLCAARARTPHRGTLS